MHRTWGGLCPFDGIGQRVSSSALETTVTELIAIAAPASAGVRWPVAASGTPTPSTPGQNGAGVLRQGYVETSNVNVAEELVSMIQAQRAFELNSKVVSTSDQMLSRLTQL